MQPNDFPEGFLKRIRNLAEKELVDLCFKMAERHGDTFVELVMALGKAAELPASEREQEIEFSHGRVKFSGQQMVELRRLSNDASQKVTVIKKIREITGLGLKEAKDLCEEVFMKAA